MVRVFDFKVLCSLSCKQAMPCTNQMKRNIVLVRGLVTAPGSGARHDRLIRQSAGRVASYVGCNEGPAESA